MDEVAITSTIEGRVAALLAGARRLADAHDELGQLARRELPESTGLSAENVDFALSRCLETHIEPQALDRLCALSTPCERAHVLLPANVFISAARAIVLALIASPSVQVRPSRREPRLVELLQRAAPDLFEIVRRLEPRAGDQVWAYGSDATLAELEASLAPGVVLHAHGSGFGVVIIDEAELGCRSQQDMETVCDGIALDAALFDQRGCLSPRLIVMRASAGFVERFRTCLGRSQSLVEARIPSGAFSAAERAEATWYRQTLKAVGSWFALENGGIGVVHDELEPIPPAGRHLQICAVNDLAAALKAIAPWITAVAYPGRDEFYRPLLALLPGARVSMPGKMQTPPLDGPVDLRRVARG
jgi:hypothetical protein